MPKERAPVPVVKIRSSSLGKFEILTCCAAMLDEVAETFAGRPGHCEFALLRSGKRIQCDGYRFARAIVRRLVQLAESKVLREDGVDDCRSDVAQD